MIVRAQRYGAISLVRAKAPAGGGWKERTRATIELSSAAFSCWNGGFRVNANVFRRAP
jgi:hypothetical protein